MLRHEVVCALVIVGCGGTIVGPASDASSDGSTQADSGTISDAVSSACSTSEGYELCGAATICNVNCTCSGKDYGTCVTAPSPYDGLDCTPGVDGNVCTAEHNGDGSLFWIDTAYDFGALLAQSGAATQVRYADLSLWTGDPLPNPTTCPTIGASLCGGACGQCPNNQVCVGRSPVHPVGVCDPDQTAPCGPDSAFDYPCPAPNGCFVYSVQTAAQPDANIRGICVPLAQCQALAQGLPGGGVCTPGK